MDPISSMIPSNWDIPICVWIKISDFLCLHSNWTHNLIPILALWRCEDYREIRNKNGRFKRTITTFDVPFSLSSATSCFYFVLIKNLIITCSFAFWQNSRNFQFFAPCDLCTAICQRFNKIYLFIQNLDITHSKFQNAADIYHSETQ